MAKRKPTSGTSRQKADVSAPALRGGHFLYGFHAVRAALLNEKRRLHQLHATENGIRKLADILPQAAQKGLEVIRHSPKSLDKMLHQDGLRPEPHVHQGMILLADPLPEADFAALTASGKPLLILDQLTDPRNLGAIIRTATLFGVGGIITTRRHSPPPGGALAKTASGALEYMPLLPVANMARCLRELAQADYMTIGLDEDADELLTDIMTKIGRTGGASGTGKTSGTSGTGGTGGASGTGGEDTTAASPGASLALILGAEGRGLRRLTRENCQFLAALPIAQTARDRQFTSLNVATAAALALYEITRPSALKLAKQ